MVEEILKNIYRMEIPLPKSPLKAVNSYLVKGPDRNLIIDTGWNRKECMGAMEAGLDELEVNLSETDFFITHLHSDHLGLVGNLARDSSNIYLNRLEVDRILSSGLWEDIIDHARLKGFPEEELQKVILNHPGYKYGLKPDHHISALKEGDTLGIGEYLFKCVETPGHSIGHMCLYEPDKKILVSGDHILSDISPNIQLWTDDDDPLNAYLSSLDKIYEYDVEIVLPGHRRIFKDCRGRIQELKNHHLKRIDEILSILGKGPGNAVKVASEMSWDIICESWDLFPVMQKWFATGEAVAHLKYLEEKEMIRRDFIEGKVTYSLVL